MRFFNTLGRRLQDFKPEGEVKLYTCGPTVYDYAQLGNLRSFVFDDTLRRALEFNGYSVRHVMNITDVGHLVSDSDEGEDKLEKGASREGKSVWEIAEHYIEVFKQDVAALNILPPNGYDDGRYARATDFIGEQVEIISLLLEKGFAYRTEQAVYFDVSKLPSYGELNPQQLSEKEVGARDDVITDPSKRHPQDFALWFFTVGRFENHTMHWDSPWGDGFPGWHLECSAIIHKTLGDPIDIHTGGVDHIGTHHPNEMAQTEAAFGHKLADFWLHNEFLLVDGQKMSKSLGNFYTLKDVTDKGYDPLALRLLFLQAHYRSQMNFTWESMEGAQSALGRLKAFADLRFQAKDIPAIDKALFQNQIEAIRQAVSDDLNTPKALAQVFSFIDQLRLLPQGNLDDTVSFLEQLDRLLGLKLSEGQDITEEQKRLIGEREAARQNQDWVAADKIRGELLGQGIELNDTEHGSIWLRA